MSENIAKTLNNLIVPINKVKGRKQNPRRGNIDTIKESLEINGQYRPIVVNKKTSEVLAGNHTLKAAKALGWKNIAVTYVDVNEEDATKIVLIDNRANDKAEYNNEELATVLKSLNFEFEGTGYKEEDLNKILAEILPATDPYEEWQGMPEFNQEDKESAYRTTVHFITNEDADKFFKMLKISKTQSFWWPENDGLVGSDTKVEWIAEK